MDLQGVSLGLINKLRQELKKFKTNDISKILERIDTLEQNYTNLSQTYNNHRHSYTDDTISDTADGTGIVSSSTKNTQGPE